LFIRRSHLRERVMLLLKEVSMSRPRLAVSFVTMAVALVVGGRLVVSAFPLQGTTPTRQLELTSLTGDYDALLKNYQSLLAKHEDSTVAAKLPAPAVRPTAVTPQATQTAKPQGSLLPGEPVPQPAKPRETAGGLTKIHDVRPVYPPEAAAAGVSGAVILTINIDAAGLVTDAKVLKGDITLADAALDAVRQWRYRPPASAPVTATVAVNVVDADQPVSVPEGVRVGGDIKPPTKIKHVPPVYPEAAKKDGVQGVVIAEAKVDPTGTVADARILRSVRLLDVAALEAIMQWKFTPTLLNGAPVPVMMTVTVNFVLDSKPKTTGVEGGVSGGVPGGVQGGVVGGIPGGVGGGTGAGVPGGLVGGIVGGLTQAPPPPPPPEGALRVGGSISAPTKSKHVPPVYPAEALAAKVQGVVILEAVIGKDGKVESAKVVSSIPMLDQAALDAVRQWEFTPTLVNGVAVPVVMTMTVNFTLQ
jgi:protein TonB